VYINVRALTVPTLQVHRHRPGDHHYRAKLRCNAGVELQCYGVRRLLLITRPVPVTCSVGTVNAGALMYTCCPAAMMGNAFLSVPVSAGVKSNVLVPAPRLKSKKPELPPPASPYRCPN